LLHRGIIRSIRERILQEQDMSTTDKSNGTAAGIDIESFLAEFSRGLSRGFESVAAMRRQALDAAVPQTREFLKAWQKGTDLVVDGYQQSTQIHQRLFELAVQRGHVVSRLATENVESLAKASAGVVAVLETVAGFATAAQKQAVELATTQSTSAYDAAQQQFEASNSAAADAFRRGVDTLIETQRTVLRNQDAA
jgi:hypothetical protein